jgi:hypothetical protein
MIGLCKAELVSRAPTGPGRASRSRPPPAATSDGSTPQRRKLGISASTPNRRSNRRSPPDSAAANPGMHQWRGCGASPSLNALGRVREVNEPWTIQSCLARRGGGCVLTLRVWPSGEDCCTRGGFYPASRVGKVERTVHRGGSAKSTFTAQLRTDLYVPGLGALAAPCTVGAIAGYLPTAPAIAR